MKCKTSDWTCVYHACMTDDCQKRFVVRVNKSLGPGKCEKQKQITIHYFLLLLFPLSLFLLSSCQDKEYCYECHSPIMPNTIWCGYQEGEMQNVIDWRAYWLRDTMTCELKLYNP